MKQPYFKGLMKNVLVASSIGLLGMTYSFAEVTLNVDDNTKVTSINGNTIKHSLFKPAQTTFTLQPGKHVITAKYDRMFNPKSNDHDYVKSDEVTVTVEVDDNQNYKLVWLNEPKSYEDIKDYIQNPTLAVMKDSQIVAKQTGTTNGNSGGGFLSGLTGLFGGGNKAQANQQQAIPPVNNSSTPTYTSQPITTGAAPNHANASTLDNFMKIWLQATPEERAKIREWVEE